MREKILRQIEKTAAEARRKPEDIELIAVSKQQPDERVDAMLAEGQRIFGENRVQEAFMRWAERRAAYPDLSLHLIGPLQSNKAAEAVGLFDVIHTIDRPKIAQSLSQHMKEQNRHLPCFIQVNTGNEPQKSGIPAEQIPDFLHFCRHEQGLNICGLMCIPPIDEEPAMHFALLKTWADRTNLEKLSMGMSSDFDQAILFGTTHIRVGSALFGERPKK